MHAGANTHRASSNDFEGATPCWAAGRRCRALIAEPRAIHSSNCMAISTAAKRAQPPIVNGGQTCPAANASRARQHAAQVSHGRRRIQLEYSSMATNWWMGAVRSHQRKQCRFNLRRLSQNARVRARGGRSARSQPAARPSCLDEMASCPHGNLEVWPVTGSAVTSGTSGHSEEALGIGKGASSAAWQRHLKAKHARLGVGALRSRSGT
jgi:hypothetical protein